MSCFKCSCGCDRLSKAELENIIKSTDRLQDFCNNQVARNMFRSMVYADEKRPKPNAIKYLENIEEAERLLKAENVSDNVEEFADRIDENLGNQLTSSTSNRPAVLQEIIKFYGIKLIETVNYKGFVKNLREAYDGKLKLEKN